MFDLFNVVFEFDVKIMFLFLFLVGLIVELFICMFII